MNTTERKGRGLPMRSRTVLPMHPRMALPMLIRKAALGILALISLSACDRVAQWTGSSRGTASTAEIRTNAPGDSSARSEGSGKGGSTQGDPQAGAPGARGDGASRDASARGEAGSEGAAKGGADRDGAARREASANESASRSEVGDKDPLVVKIRPEMAKRFTVGSAQRQEVASILEVPGRLEANEKLISRIGASVTGRVLETMVDVGYRVRAGDIVARVSSPELTQAQLNFLRANSSFSLAERAVERARQLFAADVISAAELQRRETELAVARAELRAANDHLSLLGFDAAMQTRIRDSGQLDSSVAVRASRPGVVLERNVSPGQVAQPGDPLFTVVDLSALWAVGALPEQSASFVRVGQSVEIEVPALGNRRFRARIVFVGDIVQPETRTVAIRTEVDNASRELKPQMLAKLLLLGPKESVLAVPESAVVREGDRDHVFVRAGEGAFRLQAVELGPAVQGRRAVLRGLQEGTPIVREGAFHLNNERKRAELE